MIEQHSAGIITFCIKDHERYYLLLHYVSGHWDFPKGKLEAGETHEQAAAREMVEETGLTAHLIPGFSRSLSYIFKERGKVIKKEVTFFIGQTTEQHVQLSREHQGYHWLTFEHAYDRLTYANAKEILDDANSFIKQLSK